jgi:hypothetical protein
MNRRTIAPLTALLALAATAAAAQVAYIPPNAPQPRFGGEFALSDPGPVAGYWATQCKVLRMKAQEHRDGPPASPAVDAALKRFIAGISAEKPPYGDMTAAMSVAVRRNLQLYWPNLNRLGEATANKKIDRDGSGNDVYVVDLKGGRTHWNIAVDRDGKIDGAMVCAGTGV